MSARPEVKWASDRYVVAESDLHGHKVWSADIDVSAAPNEPLVIDFDGATMGARTRTAAERLWDWMTDHFARFSREPR